MIVWPVASPSRSRPLPPLDLTPEQPQAKAQPQNAGEKEPPPLGHLRAYMNAIDLGRTTLAVSLVPSERTFRPSHP
jgi:hypothetical protein